MKELQVSRILVPSLVFTAFWKTMIELGDKLGGLTFSKILVLAWYYK
jgi:hypothetical protein